MDIEELNKTQIILLTLLVSFVSAIATSIFTVKILEQAPTAVTQTINRVVERTVERVIPAEPTKGSVVKQNVIEKVTTIVVKEDDLITESIEKNKKKIVRLVKVTSTEVAPPVGSTSTEPTIKKSYVFHGIGVIVSADGLIATAPGLELIENLVAVTPNGVEHTISVVTSTGEVSILRVEPSTSEEVISLSPVQFVDESTLKLGQTVISLSGAERTNVSTGIIAGLEAGKVYTNMADSLPGSPLMNIFGEIVGINTLSTAGLFTSSSRITESMATISATETTSVESTETSSIETNTQEG